jgi:hypothetical protein
MVVVASSLGTQAATPLLDLVLGDIPLDTYYGELIRGTEVLPWRP